MEKSTFTDLGERFRQRLVEMRQESGLTQRELAEHLGRERSFVSRVEQGERRVDVVEFYWICCACGVDPSEVAVSLMAEFEKLKRKARRGSR